MGKEKRYYFKEYTIKEWQDKWEDGEFDNIETLLHPQIAGLWKWDCKTSRAYNSLNEFASLIKRLESSNILNTEKMTVSMCITDPSVAQKYKVLQIARAEEDSPIFSVLIDYPYSDNKWMLKGFTSQNKWGTIKEFSNVYQLANWLNDKESE